MSNTYQQGDLLLAENIIYGTSEYVKYHSYHLQEKDDLVTTFPDSGGRNGNITVYKGSSYKLYPLKITEDFLLANGFEYMECEQSCGFSKDKFHCIWDHTFTNVISEKQIYDKVIKEHTFIQLEYVHELQQLFRLYHIDMEWRLPITWTNKH